MERKPNRTHLCKRGVDPTLAEIRAQCVETEQGCWEWQRTRNKHGYGTVRFGGRTRSTHTVAYELSKGPIPTGLCVLHRCDNPSCVRPEHLFMGTHADNTRDKLSKGRHRSPRGEDHGGAKLTAAQVSHIRASPKSNVDLARELGVSYAAIRDVRVGRNWKNVEGKIIEPRPSHGEKHWSAKLTVELAEYVRSSPKSHAALGRELGVTPASIRDVRTGKTWKHVKASAA